MEENGDLKQCIIDYYNSHIKESKGTVCPNSCSSYRYTPQQIEEFFASDNGQAADQ